MHSSCCNTTALSPACTHTAVTRTRTMARSSAGLLLLACLVLVQASTHGVAARKLLQGNRPSWAGQGGGWGGGQGQQQRPGAGNVPAWTQQGGNNNPWGAPSNWGMLQQQQAPSQSQSQAGSGSGAMQQQQPVQQRPNRNKNKGDLNSLSGLTSGALGYRGRPRTTIAAPTTGPASTLFQDMRRGGNARATAQSLANTFGSNSEAAASAVASAATQSSGSEASAVAEAIAQTSVAAPNVAPGLLAKSADIAVTRGQTDAFASTMADAFGAAKRNSIVPQFTRSVADAVAQGGPSTRLAVGEAMATAIAGGGDSKAAVAEATATAFCAGGSTAQSWASAFAVALSKDRNGCLVLNEAQAIAQARCAGSVAETFSKAEATSLVLGFCGLGDLIPAFSFNSGQGGANSWSG